jgi:hypothetical protein
MIRTLPFLFLTACSAFPQLEAELSKDIGPRPAMLTASELQDLLSAGTQGAPSQNQDDLRDRADALRAR